MKIKLLKNYYSAISRQVKSTKTKVGSFDFIDTSSDKIEPFSYVDKNRIDIKVQRQGSTVDETYITEGVVSVNYNEGLHEFSVNSLKNKNFSGIVKKSFSDDERYRIVLDGNNGTYSIAEICKNEGISHDEFLQWSNEFLQISKKRLNRITLNDYHTLSVKELIENLIGKDVLEYFESFIDVTSKETIVIKEYNGHFEDNSLIGKSNLVCLSKINEIININNYFELINSKLPKGGIFIGCLETLTDRKKRFRKSSFPIMNNLYCGYEFLLKRVFPKLGLTKKIYFKITKGKDRILSEAEILGRLVKSGFEIMDLRSIDGLVYFVVKKEKKPIKDSNPSCGIIYKTPRLSKNGKIIQIYKFRTMHPYSEYLHDYVLKVNGYANSGKPANDFRIPAWGKIMRKIWIDELPQLINVLKGDLKLVGIRPVSKRYFMDIPKEMQKLRLTQKPGCIPPYVSLNKKGNVLSVLQSEKEYLEEKIKYPYTTDTKYFFMAIFNIIFRNKRSA